MVNLLLGSGEHVGAELTCNPLLDAVSFTGGYITGSKIAAAAASLATKVTLELGGKNPHIIFADALDDSESFRNTIDYASAGVFTHSGQVCSAGTRIIVEESIAEKFTTALINKALSIRIGNGMNPSSQTGPLVSQEHLHKVHNYVNLGIEEGAQLRIGGKPPEDPELAKGYFYLPTIFSHCNCTMRLVQEETFGPIATIETFTTIEEAIELGNDTRYGLAAGIQSKDLDKANYVAKALRHGTIWINDFGPYQPSAEWGGFKASGNGRELGPSGLTEYQEIKHIWTKYV